MRASAASSAALVLGLLQICSAQGVMTELVSTCFTDPKFGPVIGMVWQMENQTNEMMESMKGMEIPDISSPEFSLANVIINVPGMGQFRVRDLVSWGASMLDMMLQGTISENKKNGMTMDSYPSLENMIEWGMWPYPDENSFRNVTILKGEDMMGVYGRFSWGAKEHLKMMLNLTLMNIGDSEMVEMVQEMLWSNETRIQVQEGILCMYDHIAMDEEMSMIMEEVMSRNEVEGVMSTLADTVQYVASYAGMKDDVVMMGKKLHEVVDMMDMDKDFTTIYGILMDIKSRLLEIPLMELYQHWHHLGAEIYFKLIIGEQPEVEALISRLSSLVTEDEFWTEVDNMVRMGVMVVNSEMEKCLTPGVCSQFHSLGCETARIPTVCCAKSRMITGIVMMEAKTSNMKSTIWEMMSVMPVGIEIIHETCRILLEDVSRMTKKYYLACEFGDLMGQMMETEKNFMLDMVSYVMGEGEGPVNMINLIYEVQNVSQTLIFGECPMKH